MNWNRKSKQKEKMQVIYYVKKPYKDKKDC